MTTTEPSKDISERISDDGLYRNSTQYRLWSFLPEQLTQIRKELNKNATAKIKVQLEHFKESNSSILSEQDKKGIEERAVPLSMEEELQLVNFYAKMIQSFAKKLNLPTEVTATAISFFRKFFLRNSVMDIHPKHILLTTLFLACKSENYFIGIESFAKKTKGNSETILKYEFKLLESLQFTLLNHHPYRALHGFFLDIQHVLQDKVDLNYMGRIYDICKTRIADALLTDAIFFYAPPHITLAVLLMEDETLTTKYLELKFESQAINEKQLSFSKLMNLIKECKDLILIDQPLSKAEATKIDAKLHYCLNPMLVVQSLKRLREASFPSEETSKDANAKVQKIQTK